MVRYGSGISLVWLGFLSLVHADGTVIDIQNKTGLNVAIKAFNAKGQRMRTITMDYDPYIKGDQVARLNHFTPHLELTLTKPATHAVVYQFSMHTWWGTVEQQGFTPRAIELTLTIKGNQLSIENRDPFGTFVIGDVSKNDADYKASALVAQQ